MTDNEIIKALECCKKDRFKPRCRKCPLSRYADCQIRLEHEIFPFVNRQRAEIERLHKEVGYWEAETKEARADIDQAVAESIKKFAEVIVSDYPEMECYLNCRAASILFAAYLDNTRKEMVGEG